MYHVIPEMLYSKLSQLSPTLHQLAEQQDTVSEAVNIGVPWIELL